MKLFIFFIHIVIYTNSYFQAGTTYMLFIDSNQIISNMEMNDENWQFMTFNNKLFTRFEKYFRLVFICKSLFIVFKKRP